jgi:cytochrome c553
MLRVLLDSEVAHFISEFFIMLGCRWFALLLFACVVIVILGCKKKNSAPGDGGNPSDGGNGSTTAGPKELFEQNCQKCHGSSNPSAGPGGPKKGGKGPDLSHVGSENGRTSDYLFDYIRDPKSKKSDTGMPSFQGKLSEDGIRSLAEYLAAKK